MSFDFQKFVRSPETKAALIVYEKYRRKFGLEHKHLIEITSRVFDFSEERLKQGKSSSKDHLIQIASKFVTSQLKPIL